MSKKRERFNIKETIYLNRELSDALFKVGEARDMNFNQTVRYLLEKALKSEG